MRHHTHDEVCDERRKKKSKTTRYDHEPLQIECAQRQEHVLMRTPTRNRGARIVIATIATALLTTISTQPTNPPTPPTPPPPRRQNNPSAPGTLSSRPGDHDTVMKPLTAGASPVAVAVTPDG